MIPASLQRSVSSLISQGKTREALTKLASSKAITDNPQRNKYLTLITAQFKKYQIDEVRLEFVLFAGNSEMRYKSLLPELERVQKGNYSYIDGALYSDGQFNRKWRACIK